jgi:hypothetical protein
VEKSEYKVEGPHGPAGGEDQSPSGKGRDPEDKAPAKKGLQQGKEKALMLPVFTGI